MADTWRYVKRASILDKVDMLGTIHAENEFQKQEPHGEEREDDSGDPLPIVFRLENHRGYQMQAYTPYGKMMDNSYHEIFIRCGNCGHIMTLAGDSSEPQWCPECNHYLSSGG